MLRLNKNHNILVTLTNRELHLVTSPYKLSLNVLSQLILSRKATYVNTWKTTSRKPIVCEFGKLYFDNYVSCFTLYGRSCEPSFLYRLAHSSANKKIIDAVILNTPIQKHICTCNYGCNCMSGFFLALSDDNWLCMHDNVKGELLQEVYVGCNHRKDYKFKYCDWDTYGEQVVLVSVLNPGRNRNPRSHNKQHNVVVALAVFKVRPLEFHALLEIDRSMFGENCSHANVSETFLILGMGNSSIGAVHIYSFPDILLQGLKYQVRLGETCKELGSHKVGSFPFGLPLNCQINEAPPLLFVVQCSEQVVQFGGFPWQYILIPPRSCGVFQVKSVSDHSIAENGELHFQGYDCEQDNAMFHPDNSGRIIFKSPHLIQFFELTTINSVKINLKEFSSMTFNENFPTNGNSAKERRISSRGRVLNLTKNCMNFNHIEKSILCTDYEDDLDLFGIMGFNPCDPNCYGAVKLYDNMSGKEVKCVPLGISLNELNYYRLIIDLDCIVVIEKTEKGKFGCYVYQLKTR